MENHDHLHHHPDVVYGDKHRPRGWRAASDSMPYISHSSKWSSDLKDSFPLLRYSMKFISGAKSAIRRKASFWGFNFSFDRSRLTRYNSSSPRRSLLAGPSASTLRFILLCSLWYSSSAMSSNTGKSIMNQFQYPVTLTFIQFAFVAFYCALSMSPAIRFSKMRQPSRAIFRATVPMGAFQVGGHIFSSMAISRIPVSTVHTIKALSPLFTVAAYALLFGVSYSPKTYISLLPLTIGVMLVCTFDVSGSNIIGLLCAFGSALVFVSSNIFFKKVMPSGNNQTSSHKLDKLNLLFYSSSMAFVLMVPIWVVCDLPLLMTANRDPVHISNPDKGHDAHHSVVYYFFLNGSVHFAQNIIAFIILSSTSPVTYSIASLVKRVAVICIAIVWFSQTVHPVQALGIGMTFIGLYMYHQAKGDVEKGENRMRRVEAARDMRLPSSMDPIHAVKIPLPPLVTESVSMTSGHDRSWTSTTPTAQFGYDKSEKAFQQPVGRQRRATVSIQHGPHPNLHITTQGSSRIDSPKDVNMNSYPSPPASLDSPPHTAVPFVSQNQYSVNSWISKRGGPLSATVGRNVMEDPRVVVVA